MNSAALLPAEIRPEQITIVVDTREQTPLDVSPCMCERGTLSFGDYSIRGLEASVSVERKSLEDLLACVGRERDRFEREMQTLRGFPYRALLIEAEWCHLQRGGWRSHVTPAQVTGSLLGWAALGIPLLMVGSHDEASRVVSRFLFIVARRVYRTARGFVESMQEAEGGA